MKICSKLLGLMSCAVLLSAQNGWASEGPAIGGKLPGGGNKQPTTKYCQYKSCYRVNENNNTCVSTTSTVGASDPCPPSTCKTNADCGAIKVQPK